MASNKRPVFSKGQVEAYFDRLRLPQHHRKFSVEGLSGDASLKHLEVLQKYHLRAIPFENLSLHYSQHRGVSLNIDALFKKIVLTPGRGGYCMENNCMFGTLLRSLGYQLYSAGGRVNNGGIYTAWSHMVNLVTIDGEKYVVDVGFGPNGSTHPLLLTHGGKDDASPSSPNIRPASVRLAYKNIDANTDPGQRVWVLQHRNDDEAQWEDMYLFTELEFLQNDYELMNYYTATSTKSWFTQQVVCALLILGPGDDGEDPQGSVIVQHDFKIRMHGKVTERREFKTEEERVQALEEHFGIKLAPEEQAGIKGLLSEIKAKWEGL